MNGNILPELSVKDEAGNWAGINPDGIAAVKDELMAGRAVSVQYCADKSQPEETDAATEIYGLYHMGVLY